jgi:transcriptional regulator with XRE-family HTH domain
MSGRNGSASRLWLTRSYNFIDKDPEIDRFRTLWQKESLRESELAVLAGVATSTVANMFGGKTRKPQHATFAKLAGAMGYSYGLTRQIKPKYEDELPIARDQRKKYLEALRKKRDK